MSEEIPELKGPYLTIDEKFLQMVNRAKDITGATPEELIEGARQIYTPNSTIEIDGPIVLWGKAKNV